MSPVEALGVPPKPTPLPMWRRPALYLQLLVGGLFGGFGVLAANRAMGGVSVLDAAMVVAALLPAAWLHLVAHEAGHALMGWAGGQHVAAIGFGPWRLERGADGWRARKAGDVKGIGGFALVLPKTEVLSRGARTAYLLGGPMANLILALGCIAVVGGLGIDGRAAALLHVFAVVGAIIGLLNLVPFLSGGWSSDGRQLLALWRRWPEARLVERMNRWAAMAMLGVRPRDWPTDSMDDAGSADARAPQALRDAMARCLLVIALDRGEGASEAAQRWARALAGGFWQGPDGLRQITAGLLATWSHKTGADTAVIEAWLSESEGGLLDQGAARAWLRAALARTRGDEAEVQLRLAEARSALPRVLDPASRVMLEEELRAMEAVGTLGTGPSSATMV